MRYGSIGWSVGAVLGYSAACKGAKDLCAQPGTTAAHAAQGDTEAGGTPSQFVMEVCARVCACPASSVQYSRTAVQADIIPTHSHTNSHYPLSTATPLLLHAHNGTVSRQHTHSRANSHDPLPGQAGGRPEDAPAGGGGVSAGADVVEAGVGALTLSGGPKRVVAMIGDGSFQVGQGVHPQGA